MDAEGHKAIVDALLMVDIRADVTPVPEEGEHVEYVTVDTVLKLRPAFVLNALARAGPMATNAAIQETVYPERHDSTSRIDTDTVAGPKLQVLFGQPGNITFIDTNNGR